MVQKMSCPVCKSDAITEIYKTTLPVLQNRVYETIEEAVNSKKGDITLSFCDTCSFTFNSQFDTDIIIYDEHYENSVPSKLFHDYYVYISNYLYDKYDLKNEVVYDIGCGKGTFLNILCDLHPDVTGIGVDPSYEGDLKPRENLTFIKDFFDESQISSKPKLVLSRHVFEHIEYPTSFLNIIQNALKAYNDVPFFIEVPDFQWIVANKTFWDICYEHCNYFSVPALAELVNGAGAGLESITPAFSDQYLWVEGVLNASVIKQAAPNKQKLPKTEVLNFVNFIELLRDNSKQLILKYKSEGYKIVVWGMATKGVIFSNIVDPHKEIIDYCIDINATKQFKYSAITGHQILPPSVLIKEHHPKALIVIMNTNYFREIKAELSEYYSSAVFIDAHGNIL